MLSEYIPQWLIALVSPILTLLGDKISAALKPIVGFAMCLAIVGYAIVSSPLGMAELIPQAIILFGMVVGGYTIAKGADSIPTKTVAGTALVLLATLGIGSAIAQTASPPVAETAYVWSQWGLGALGGLVARLIKRYVRW